MASTPSRNRHPVSGVKLKLQLFATFFEIGAFTFGGGFAMVPLVRRELVERLRLLTDEEFIDACSVIQGSPGAIAINLATFCGQKLAGTGGALAATIGAALPSYLVLMTIASLFSRVASAPIMTAIFTGARPAITALIISAVLRLAKTAIKKKTDTMVAAVALVLLAVFKVHPAFVIAGAAIYGALALKMADTPRKEGLR